MIYNTMQSTAQQQPLMVQNNENSTLFIGDIDKTIDIKILENELSRFGQITNKQLLPNRYQQDLTNALYTFENDQQAQQVLKEMNGFKYGNHLLRVNIKLQKTVFDTQANVFVRNIGTKQPLEFQELMEQFGKIHSCKIQQNDYGYVQYVNKEDAQKAIQNLNYTEHWGKILELEIFKPSKYRNQQVSLVQVYLKNLPLQWSEVEVQDFINKEMGDLGKIQKIANWKGKDGTQQACIDFENEKQAKKAIQKMNGFKIDEKISLESDFYLSTQQRKQKYDGIKNIAEQKTIFLQGVRVDVTDSEIEQLFNKISVSKVSTVSSKKINNKFKPGEQFLQVYVNFLSSEDVQKVYYDGKLNPEIRNLFIPDFLTRGKFISLYQSKKVRDDFKQMGNSIKNTSTINMGQQNLINTGVPMFLPGQLQPGVMPNQSMNMYQQTSQQQNIINPLLSQKQENKYDSLEKIKSNFDSFQNEDSTLHRSVLGEMMYTKVNSYKDCPKNYVAKVTGMLIDLEILGIEEIIDILDNEQSFKERFQEALEIVKEEEEQNQ